MPDDAVYVYCNLTAEGETCVAPDIHSSQITNIPWRKENDHNNWYSNLRGGFRITYESIGTVQMTFLRLLSQEGYQNFTYTCINSAAWYSDDLDSNEMAIKFLGENELEIGHDSLAIRPNVFEDGCKVNVPVIKKSFSFSIITINFSHTQSGKSNSRTVFHMRTKKLSYLPLIDFYPVDYGRPNQAFGFQVGPLCFK